MYRYILILGILLIFIIPFIIHIIVNADREAEAEAEAEAEGFTDRSTHGVNVLNYMANLAPDTDQSSAKVNAFNSKAFHRRSTYIIDPSLSNATASLLNDISFCQAAANSNNPFSNSRFASTCGICMTRGTILLNNFPFSQATNRAGTGVVVYQADKDFSLREGTQAIPSSHSASCDTLLLDSNSIPPDVSPGNLTGLVINEQQYADTTKYLESVNIISFSDTNKCGHGMSQPVTCANENTTVSFMRFLYGHFTEECEAGSNDIKTEIYPSDCLGKSSCTFSMNLPAGERQWFLDAQCKVQEDTIPSGLPTMNQRSIAAMTTTLSNVSYFWAEPFSSITSDIKQYTIYSSVTVPNDTQVQIEYCTNASFTMYLHTLKQYTHPNPGSRFIYMSNSPIFALYKGDNIIRLSINSTNTRNNGLYFMIKDMNGTPLTTLDSTWVYSVPEGFDSPPPTGMYPVRAKTVWSNASINASIIAPKSQGTTTINYFKQINIASNTLLTLGTCVFDSSIVNPLTNSFTYNIYLSHGGVEKLVAASKDNNDRVQVYSEYFPAGITGIRVSVHGNGNTCFIALLADANNTVIAVSDNSWTCDEVGYSGPMIDILMHCDAYSQSLGRFGPGTYHAGQDFNSDASYVKVPVGLSALLTSTAGTTRIVPGGSGFNFCDQMEFNDKTQTIVVSVA